MVLIQIGTMAYAKHIDPKTGAITYANAWHMKAPLETWLASIPGGVARDGKTGLWDHVPNALYEFKVSGDHVPADGKALQLFIETFAGQPPPSSLLDHLCSTKIDFCGSLQAGTYTVWFADAKTDSDWNEFAYYHQRHKPAKMIS